jgi:hypothetical protein
VQFNLKESQELQVENAQGWLATFLASSVGWSRLRIDKPEVS